MKCILCKMYEPSQAELNKKLFAWLGEQTNSVEIIEREADLDPRLARVALLLRRARARSGRGKVSTSNWCGSGRTERSDCTSSHSRTSSGKRDQSLRSASICRTRLARWVDIDMRCPP